MMIRTAEDLAGLFATGVFAETAGESAVVGPVGRIPAMVPPTAGFTVVTVEGRTFRVTVQQQP